ncbi:MAG TPA: MerR family transcriptional regulator [Actinomycetota bacterium]|nr:MerR family transcriptional regulator [Actinomycetota bacterium]
MYDAALTIDELARAVGMTVRTIRSHHTRGLLPAAELRGRTALYGDEHVARLQLIKEMQASGFNLAAIKQLLDSAAPGSGIELLRFERALLAPPDDEQPETFGPQDLVDLFASPTPEALARAEGLGVISARPDGTYVAPSPALVRAGAAVVTMGIPLERALDVLEEMMTGARHVAAAFVKLFNEELWEPFDREGRPDERWSEVRSAVESLRPLGSAALLTVFNRIMADEIEQSLARQLDEGMGESAVGE